MSYRGVLLGCIFASVVVAIVWLVFAPTTSLSSSEAEIYAADRFKSYCAETRGKPCDGFARELPKREKDGWYVEYQNPNPPVEFLAFFVHDDGRVEVSKFKDDTERAKSDAEH